MRKRSFAPGEKIVQQGRDAALSTHGCGQNRDITKLVCNSTRSLQASLAWGQCVFLVGEFKQDMISIMFSS